MNKQELQVAIDKLTAMSEFALDLRVTLTQMLNAPDADVVNQVADKAVACVKEAIKEVKAEKAVAPAVEDTQEDEVDLTSIIAEYELDKMKPADLKEYLDSYGVEYPAKAKKAELVSILAQAIADGILDDDADSDNDGTDVQEDTDVVTDQVDEKDADGDDSDDFEVSDERQQAEDSVEDKIRTSFGKKLKLTAIKKFLKTYYDGDAELADLDELDEDELLDMYIEIQRALVDDDGDVHEMEEAYPRNGVYFCCGKEAVTMEDSENIYCEVCGNEYD